MDFAHPTTPEAQIIASLATKSLSGEVLLQQVRTLKASFTKQALYVILRRLLAQEVVVKHGTQYSLSNVWLSKMYQFFLVAKERYGVTQESVDFLMLNDGDRISYNFKGLNETDGFWGHAFDVLAAVTPSTEPIYLYNPHEWFLYARAANELHLFNKLRNDKRQLWLTVGHTDPLDIHAKQYFDGTYLQYHMLEKPLFDKEYYYLNIFGDYIIEATIDPETARAVDQLYKSTKEWSERINVELHSLVAKGKTKLTISRNERKAKKLKRVLGQYFFLKK